MGSTLPQDREDNDYELQQALIASLAEPGPPPSLPHPHPTPVMGRGQAHINGRRAWATPQSPSTTSSSSGMSSPHTPHHPPSRSTHACSHPQANPSGAVSPTPGLSGLAAPRGLPQHAGRTSKSANSSWAAQQPAISTTLQSSSQAPGCHSGQPTTAAAAKEVTRWQVAKPQGSRATKASRNPGNSQPTASLTIDDLERQGKVLPAVFRNTTSMPARTAKSEEELLAEVAAESAPDQTMTAVSAKQRSLEAVSDEYHISKAGQAHQPPAADSMDGERRRLLDEAAKRAAEKTAAERRAADVIACKGGRSREKGAKQPKTAEEKAASKAKAKATVAASRAESEAKASIAAKAKAERQAAAMLKPGRQLRHRQLLSSTQL